MSVVTAFQEKALRNRIATLMEMLCLVDEAQCILTTDCNPCTPYPSLRTLFLSACTVMAPGRRTEAMALSQSEERGESSMETVKHRSEEIEAELKAGYPELSHAAGRSGRP